MRASAERCGLGAEALRDLLYEMPLPRRDSVRSNEPCPLSARELDVLRHLSEGMVYKQIAGEMSLSVSTIRTHLHNVYGKIGAVDRAQAVLIAQDLGLSTSTVRTHLHNTYAKLDASDRAQAVLIATDRGWI